MSGKAPTKKIVKKKAAKTEIIVSDTKKHQEQENTSIETFIAKGIESNVPVETMEKLLAMRRELKAEHAKEMFIAAMAQFQAECPIIVKDKKVFEKNSTTKVRYRYAPMDSIINQVRELIAKNGLSYTIDVSNEDGTLTAVCKITHVLGHSETSSFQVPIDKDSFMSAPQKYAAASTFAKRYALTNALGILTGDEDIDASPESVQPDAPVKRSPFDIAKDMIEKQTDTAVLNDYWKKVSGSDKYTAEQKDQLEGIIAARVETLEKAGAEKTIEA